MTENNKFTEYCIPRDDIAYVVEFCNIDVSSQLLAVGTEARVSIYTCKFKEEDDEVEEFEVTNTYDFQNGCRVTAIAWSPETSMLALPKVVRLAAAGSDRRIRIFSTDLKGQDEVQILEGHTDFINSLTFDPENGDQIASTGDDKWCKIWGRDGEPNLFFPLKAPGMSVCWHRDEPLKVLVAQKDGVIKLFSLSSQQQLMSFECGQTPLMQADWSLGNNALLLGAIAGTDIMLFDLSVSSQPVDRRQIHIEGGRNFQWARCHDSMVATVGRPGRQIKVFNTKHQQSPVTISQQTVYGISWHHKLPALATAGDKKIHIYMFDYI